MTSDATMSDKIVELSLLWYEYVTMDHHKGRDCHWYISVDYGYGRAPKYRAYHSGYITDADLQASDLDSLAGAEAVLLGFIRSAMVEQIEWARLVLAEPDEYDAEQNASARFALERFPAALKLHSIFNRAPVYGE